MFKAEIEEVGLLKDSMKTISDLISEGLFQLNEDGIQLVAADPAMVGLVDFTLKEDIFETYSLDEKGQKVGLNIENLYSILRRANSSDTITLEVEEDSSKFKIKMENNTTRDFSLPILNLSEDDIPSVGDLDQFTFNADLDTDVLESAIKDAMVVSDAVTITADGSSLNISAEGDQSGVDFTVKSEAEGVHEMNGSDAKSMFSLDYLSKMIGAKKLADTVTVKLGQDFPMRMEFEQPEKAEINFVLAPRIEEE